MRPLTGCGASWGWEGGGVVNRVGTRVLSVKATLVCVCLCTDFRETMRERISFSICECLRVRVADKAYSFHSTMGACPTEHKGNPWWSRSLWIKAYSCLSEYLSGRSCKSGSDGQICLQGRVSVLDSISFSLSFSLSAYTQPLPSQRLPERVGSSWPRFITANSTALLLANGQRSHIMNNSAWFKRTNCYRCKFNLGETHHVAIPRSSSAVCVGEAAFRWCEVMIHVLHYVDCFLGMTSQALGDAYRLPSLLSNDFIHSAAVLDFPILVWCGWGEPLPHKKRQVAFKGAM